MPEVRHVTVPTTGGRIIIASDGVWDHMQPKSMIHQVCVCVWVLAVCGSLCGREVNGLDGTDHSPSGVSELPASAWRCVPLNHNPALSPAVMSHPCP